MDKSRRKSRLYLGASSQVFLEQGFCVASGESCSYFSTLALERCTFVCELIRIIFDKILRLCGALKDAWMPYESGSVN